MTALPDDLPALPPSAQALERAALVLHTPCGDGHVVWRRWGAGRPVVLLHGGSGSWTHWLRNIPALVHAGRQVLVPDLPGFGDSAAPPGGGDADAVVEPLAQGMHALLGPGAQDLVGFSFGSIVAGLLAAARPASVARLVLVGSPVVPLPRGRGIVLKDWSQLPTQAQRNRIHRSNLAAIMLHSPAAIDEDAVALQAVNVPRDRMRGRRLVTTDALARAISQVRCPLAAIYGTEDVLCRDSWPQIEAVLRANPHFVERVSLPGAGHWVQYELPAAFDAALLRLLG